MDLVWKRLLNGRRVDEIEGEERVCRARSNQEFGSLYNGFETEPCTEVFRVTQLSSENVEEESTMWKGRSLYLAGDTEVNAEQRSG